MIYLHRKCVELLLEIAEKGALDLTVKDKDGLLAYDLCQDEHTKQLLWDKTKQQMAEKERIAKENAVEKFAVNTSTENKESTKKPLRIKVKGKGKGKKKMKIKLKK